MVEVYEGALDRGLEGVVACSTAVSSIVDATLCYKGYTIEDIAHNSTFEEVVHLLWKGEVPSDQELKDLNVNIDASIELPDDLLAALGTIPYQNVNAMAWLRTAVSMLGLWDKDSESLDDGDQIKIGYRLLSRIPSLIAFFECKRSGRDFKKPQKGKSIAWNFLRSLRGEEPAPEMVKVLDTCLVLHADHELNCSAFSSRVTASSLSDIYSAITTAIGSLKGPLHGGANTAVMKMLKEIDDVDKAGEWVKEALDNKVKIMGFGHRVYRNGDPRAKVLKGMSKSLCEMTGNSKWFEMSSIIENEVVSQKGLLPNVDFYSATVYHAMGIPTDLFTPIFAMSRVSGWLAHVFEQYKNNRIYRPRGKWVGPKNLKLGS